LLAIGAYGDQKAVDAHRGIYGDFATELVLDLACLDCIRAMFVDDVEELLTVLDITFQQLQLCAYV